MGCPPLRCWSRWLRKRLLVWRGPRRHLLGWASSHRPVPVSVRVLGWHLRLVLVVWARLASRVLLVWQALVVRVARVSVVSRPRWLPVPVVLAVLPLVVLVVWLAQSAPVPVLVLVVGVDPVHTVRVVACRVMRTRVWRLVLRVLLLVGRWVLARALPVPGLVLVWALVVVLQVLARVCQVLRARCRVRQRPLVPVRVRPVVVGV